MGTKWTPEMKAERSAQQKLLWAQKKADKEAAKAKEALQALNEYIGTYKGNGSPDKPRPDPKETWGEKVDWSWRFKGEDCWLRMEVDKATGYGA